LSAAAPASAGRCAPDVPSSPCSPAVAVPLHQLVVKVLHGEVRIAAMLQIQHPRNLRHARRPRGALPQPAVRQARRTFVKQAIAPAPKRPSADPKQPHPLDLARLATFLAIEQPLKSHLAHPSCISLPLGWSSSKTGHITSCPIQTDHMLPTHTRN
jgi:hypothetical protein